MKPDDAPFDRILPSDPIIEQYKKGLDVGLLVESLRRTPEQRIVAIMDMQRLVEEMRRGNSGNSRNTGSKR